MTCYAMLANGGPAKLGLSTVLVGIEIEWSFILYMDLALATEVLKCQLLTKASNNPEQFISIFGTHVWKPWSCANVWHVKTANGNRV